MSDQRERVNAKKRRQRWIDMVMGEIGAWGGSGNACYWHLRNGQREPWFHYRDMTPHE